MDQTFYGLLLHCWLCFKQCFVCCNNHANLVNIKRFTSVIIQETWALHFFLFWDHLDVTSEGCLNCSFMQSLQGFCLMLRLNIILPDLDIAYTNSLYIRDVKRVNQFVLLVYSIKLATATKPIKIEWTWGRKIFTIFFTWTSLESACFQHGKAKGANYSPTCSTMEKVNE